MSCLWENVSNSRHYELSAASLTSVAPITANIQARNITPVFKICPLSGGCFHLLTSEIEIRNGWDHKRIYSFPAPPQISTSNVPSLSPQVPPVAVLLSVIILMIPLNS